MSVLDSPRPDDLAALEAGLDALESERPVRVPRVRRLADAVWPPVVALAVLVLLWELLHRTGVAVVGPLDVGRVLAAQTADRRLPTAMFTSLARGGLGFLLAVLLGSALGLVLARVRLARRAFGPLVTGLQSLPSVAWVPVAVLVAGVDETAVFTVVLLGAVPSVANGMLSGIDQVPPLLTRAGQVLGARGFAAARLVLVPAALPGYIAGLRQGWAFSWRSLMAAELIVGSSSLEGLGQLLDQGRRSADLTAVLAGIAAILVVGIVVELCVFAPVERRVLRRRGLLSAA